MKSRVKELKRVKASELRENPANWRVHPETQRAALKGLLAEIGFAGALLARKDAEGNLILIDGHLRKEIADDEKVPVLITDLNEAEADLLLAAYDPIASMALADESKLQDLLARIHSEDEGLSELLGKMRSTEGQAIDTTILDSQASDVSEHWTGMPEYTHEDLTSSRKVIVHFRNDEDVQKFADIIGQKITEKIRSVWFPEAEIGTTGEKRWEDNES